MLENVHHQFARIGIGNAQFVAAVFKHPALLLRMPVLIGNPARPFRGEAQHGCVFCFPREDSIGTGVVRIELFFRYIAAMLWQCLGSGNAFDGEAAQGVAGMTVSVQIPVVAVMDESLRGDFA
jgi:hypothetical protein